MRLMYPYALLLLALLPVLIWLHRWRLKQPQRIALPFSSQAQLGTLPNRGFWARLYLWREGFMWLAIALLIIAFARPQRTLSSWPRWGQGIDIAMVLDTSSSMLQQDLRPNRMKVAKKLLRQFIQFRRQKDDRLGMVLFAKRAFTLCPLTVDHRMLSEMLDKVETGVIADDTALGDALATALARLRHANKRQRAILLVTDGENNAGSVHPLTAAALAKQMRIPIFPLLVGKSFAPKGDTVALPQQGKQMSPWQILQKVASTSRGSAYYATDPKSFRRALMTILDQMTPTRATKPKYYTVRQELYSLFLLPALLLIGGIMLLQFTRLRSIP